MTITTNDGRTWKVIDSKTNDKGVTGHLCHANLLPESLAFADWSIVAVKGDLVRCQVMPNESAAREKFAAI